MKKYPKIGSFVKNKRNKNKKCLCGKLGEFNTTIQFSYMRGDDDVVLTCDDHKNDLQFLVYSPEKQKFIDDSRLLRAAKLKF